MQDKGGFMKGEKMESKKMEPKETKGNHGSHETVMKSVKAMGMMSDKHMMDSESMAKMRKQMPGKMM